MLAVASRFPTHRAFTSAYRSGLSDRTVHENGMYYRSVFNSSSSSFAGGLLIVQRTGTPMHEVHCPKSPFQSQRVHTVRLRYESRFGIKQHRQLDHFPKPNSKILKITYT